MQVFNRFCSRKYETGQYFYTLYYSYRKQDRLTLWKKFQTQYEESLAAKTPEPIKITLPDGKEVDGQSWRTTPFEVAKGIRY